MEAVRCFTCNKIIGGKWIRFRDLCEHKSVEDAMNELDIKRWCCRRMFLTNVSLSEKVLDYNKVHDTMKENPYVTYKTEPISKEIRTYSAR
jgi:DNA-directed RNA polymerase subunit N (RpoN/RPB10)